jgi:hypothetical protein
MWTCSADLPGNIFGGSGSGLYGARTLPTDAAAAGPAGQELLTCHATLPSPQAKHCRSARPQPSGQVCEPPNAPTGVGTGWYGRIVQRISDIWGRRIVP